MQTLSAGNLFNHHTWVETGETGGRALITQLMRSFQTSSICASASASVNTLPNRHESGSAKLR